MAEVVFSTEERKRIDEILSVMRRTTEEFLDDARSALSSSEWELVVTYATACLRRVLEVGTSLHAVVDANQDAFAAYAGRGRETFLRDALTAWRDSYAPVEEVWRLALVYDRVPGGEKRFSADIATLEQMASNRLFRCLDEEYARLLATES